ncbi:hypothetical protein [Pseudoflavonifractor sp. An187]|uniref:hypothetical protein n=1 Tax=Pseudoflavonifractor sp. An187 TaxID=1965578 RepID=UPI000B3A6716|nr:hypothetical protein [Pseudoflavonifractor sp. An187]OUP45807.1 hypothetical protein B5F22_03380 [Pseudoflavonifractor sp. An187]
MKIGDAKTFVPSAFSELSRDGAQKRYSHPAHVKGKIIAINLRHRHFTVEGQVNGHIIRETYKFRP